MKLRLPADLKDRLAEFATENGRSLNAEVIKRLEDSIETDRAPTRSEPIDDGTLDLFADTVAGKVVRALDEREKKRAKR